MNALGFLAAVIKAAVWPGVVIFVIIVFRERLSELFDSLSSFTFHGVNVTFVRRLARAETESAKIEVKAGQNAESEEVTLASLGMSKDASPPVRITKTWYRVRDELFKCAEHYKMPQPNKLLPATSVRWLEQNGKIDRATAEAIKNLKGLRDDMKASGAADAIEDEQADTYEAIAARVIRALRARA